jgi:hypothetical protein
MDNKFDRLTGVDQSRSNILLFQYLKNNIVFIFSQTIFLLVIQIVFEPIKLTKLHQVNPYIVLNFFILKIN